MLLLIVMACKDPGAPPPPPPPAIVKLLVADPDTGFWLGTAISLSGLVTGAVTEDGDTVAAPAVAWTIPAGFVRNGDLLTASREGRGALIASLAQPQPTAGVLGSAANPITTIATAAMFDLRVYGWTVEWRCYDSPLSMRGVESPPIGVDSAIISATGDSLSYATTDWADVHLLTLWDQELVIRFWKDGVVDTLRNASAFSFVQDTTRLWIGTNRILSDPGLRRVSSDPLIYRLNPPGLCSSWRGGGTEFALTGRAR
jgi:hypothetical protein